MFTSFGQMGSLGFLLVLVLVLPLTFTYFFHQSHLFVIADADLVQKTCKSTNYYDLCMSSLKSNSSSLKADTKGLAAVMIGIGMANANGTYSYISSQLLSNTNGGTSMKKVLKECADKYSYANDALQASLQQLDLMSFDYASVQIAAAKDYPNACHNTYKRIPRLVYPLELAHREEALEHICDIALGIINLLDW